MMHVSFTPSGYLVLGHELARTHFPADTVLVMPRGEELWLLPTRGAAGGGLLLKQRNIAGDRAVLVTEALGERRLEGEYPAFWDPQQGALRVAVAARAGIGQP